MIRGYEQPRYVLRSTAEDFETKKFGWNEAGR